MGMKTTEELSHNKKTLHRKEMQPIAADLTPLEMKIEMHHHTKGLDSYNMTDIPIGSSQSLPLFTNGFRQNPLGNSIHGGLSVVAKRCLCSMSLPLVLKTKGQFP